MSYLLLCSVATESFERSQKLLGESLGLGMSATAAQQNTEATGARIDGMPYRKIPLHKRRQVCEVMVVEIDGRMSPQIKEQEGLGSRPSLGQPMDRGGACYGPRKGFEDPSGWRFRTFVTPQNIWHSSVSYLTTPRKQSRGSRAGETCCCKEKSFR
jgi:hypothetical protein